MDIAGRIQELAPRQASALFCQDPRPWMTHFLINAIAAGLGCTYTDIMSYVCYKNLRDPEVLKSYFVDVWNAANRPSDLAEEIDSIETLCQEVFSRIQALDAFDAARLFYYDPSKSYSSEDWRARFSAADIAWALDLTEAHVMEYAGHVEHPYTRDIVKQRFIDVWSDAHPEGSFSAAVADLIQQRLVVCVPHIAGRWAMKVWHFTGRLEMPSDLTSDLTVAISERFGLQPADDEWTPQLIAALKEKVASTHSE